jgi:hypothetical protein
MKSLFLFFIFILSGLQFCSAQPILPAPEDKAVVYFVRPSAMGYMINFSYFDSSQFIGQFNGRNYLRYECDPGTHLFWARCENRDFVEAELEAGRIYFIEAKVRIGWISSRVRLFPVDPGDGEKMKMITKFVESRSEDWQNISGRGLRKYKKRTAKGKQFMRMEKSMYYKE